MRKKVVCAFLVSMFLLSMMLLTGIKEVEAQGATVLYVDPPISYAALGYTFMINVSIANVTNLSAYEFKLGYNTTILDCIKLVIQPFLNEPTWLMKKEINDVDGYVWVAIASLWPAVAVNGSGTLATITFQVVNMGECVLDLYNTELINDKAKVIAHSVEDGYFEYRPLEHDIAAFLDTPRHLMPGGSAMLNATVFNVGLNNETAVKLRLLINGSIVNSTVISFLRVGSSYKLSYLLKTQKIETTYNVTAYALPVPNEDDTKNNVKSTRVYVSYTIRVPFHYPTIQEAIDAANSEATIIVSPGTYYEWLTIDKSLKLIGEESSRPIIDGSGRDMVIHVKADNVEISKFTIQNGGLRGVFVDGCNHVTIRDNKITNNLGYGIHLDGSNNSITGNTIMNSGLAGIALTGSNNVIYHNNFINNTRQVTGDLNMNIWDNGCEGNYWSNYNGTDWNQTTCSLGIGDDYLPWEGVDYHPLMSPYIEGDVDHNGVVRIRDVVIVALAFGTKRGDPKWNPHADMDGNGEIRIRDIVIVALHFGEKW